MSLAIRVLKAGQIDAAKAVVTAGCMEFFGRPPANFGDMDDLAAHYGPPSGVFLALTDGERVVGTGAVRRVDDRVCELKRMWFLTEYRGKGHGTKMAGELLDFAHSAGYALARLDTDPSLAAANRLYLRLGFVETKRYTNGPCIIIMEKQL